MSNMVQEQIYDRYGRPITVPYVDMQKHIVQGEPHPWFTFPSVQQAHEGGPVDPREQQYQRVMDETASAWKEELSPEDRGKFYELRQKNPQESEADLLLQMKEREHKKLQGGVLRKEDWERYLEENSIDLDDLSVDASEAK